MSLSARPTRVRWKRYRCVIRCRTGDVHSLCSTVGIDTATRSFVPPPSVAVKPQIRPGRPVSARLLQRWHIDLASMLRNHSLASHTHHHTRACEDACGDHSLSRITASPPLSHSSRPYRRTHRVDDHTYQRAHGVFDLLPFFPPSYPRSPPASVVFTL